jgi:hypothetical protein
MARKTLTELKAQFLKSFPDPSTDMIEGGRLFELLENLLDSFTPAYGVLSTTAPVVQSLTTVDQKILWNTKYIEQIPEFTVRVAPSADITRNEGPCTNHISVNVDVELAANREVEMTLYANGVATVWRAKASGSGSGRPVVLSMEAIHYSAVPVTYELRALVDTATSVTFTNGVFLVDVVPVRES